MIPKYAIPTIRGSKSGQSSGTMKIGKIQTIAKFQIHAAHLPFPYTALENRRRRVPLRNNRVPLRSNREFMMPP
jgi:hypothetical protein